MVVQLNGYNPGLLILSCRFDSYYDQIRKYAKVKYKIGDRIIFNKKYIKKEGDYVINGAIGWVEPWLIGQVATITKIVRARSREFYWYYIDIPDTHGYDEPLFSKIEDSEEMLVEI